MIALALFFAGALPAGMTDRIAVLWNAPSLASPGDPSAEPVSVSGRVLLCNELSVDLLTPVTGTRNEAERLLAVRRRPSLTLTGSTLKLSGPEDRQSLAVRRLILDNAQIVLNGGSLTIEVEELTVRGKSRIASFEDPNHATQGQPGRRGGRVVVIVHRAIAGELVLDLRGERGGDGSQGQPGLPGRREREARTACPVSSIAGAAWGAGFQEDPADQAKPAGRVCPAAMVEPHSSSSARMFLSGR